MKVFLLYIQDHEDLRFFGIFKTIKKSIKEARRLLKEYEDDFKDEIFMLDGFKLNKSFYSESKEELEGLCFFGSEIHNDLKIKQCIKIIKEKNKS